MKLFRSGKRLLVIPVVLALAALGGATSALLAVCGPFTDVSGPFCPFILQIYYLGITAGTSPTTYSPDDPVTRAQAAVFIARSFDQSVKRSSRRAALDQWWTPQNAQSLGLTTVGTLPLLVKSDGADLWVANLITGTVSRVRASDGKLLETWTGASSATGVLVAMGRVFVTGQTFPGSLYMIDPTQAAGAVTTVVSSLGASPLEMAFDGSRIWTANQNGSVSIVTPGPTLPWAVTTIMTGFSTPVGILYDGTNIWVTNHGPGTLLKLDSNGSILQTVTVGMMPDFPSFDGTNIWVPNAGSNSVTVVRASTGAVLATLTGNGLNTPYATAFDGERILVTNQNGSSVSLWKAADLMPLGSFSTGPGTNPFGACSDGLNFWITLPGTGQLARF